MLGGKGSVMEKTIHHAVNVEVIDEAFYIPQLQRNRRIWLYKPGDYYRTDKKYPVIYMHDGQNLFDGDTAFGEEWGVDETLNKLGAECIVVGIDNSQHRLTEYNFHDHEEYGPGEGRQYMNFIIQTLKPVIDRNFRTKRGRTHTYIAGSSMGGLISLYGAIYFPETFSAAGIFSPSLWLVPGFRNELKKVADANRKLAQRFYLYGGAKESEEMVVHIHETANLLKGYSKNSVHVEIEPEGEHNEYHWRTRFENFYLWLTHHTSPAGSVGYQSSSRH